MGAITPGRFGSNIYYSQLRVLEFDPFVSDLVVGSSRCERLIAAFIASLEFGVSSTNDNSCWFSKSMNWKHCLFLRRTMKRGFQLTIFLYVIYFSFKFLVDKFPGVEVDFSDCWARWIRLCCLVQYV